MRTLVTFVRPSGSIPFARLWTVLRTIAAKVRGRLHAWAERDRSRRELRELDAATLRDLGLSRADADFIGSRPFWRA